MVREHLTVGVVAFLLGASADPGGAQVVTEMTPERVLEAIQLAGQEQSALENEGCYALAAAPLKTGEGQLWELGRGLPAGAEADRFNLGQRRAIYGVFTTPYSRVYLAAREARRRHQSLTVAEVRPEMIAPEVRIHVPSRLRGTADADTTHTDVLSVTMMRAFPRGSTDRREAVKPIRMKPLMPECRRVPGGRIGGDGVTAAFPLAVLEKGYDVQVVFDGVVQFAAGSCSRCTAQLIPEVVR